jgi:hypothetical protein
VGAATISATFQNILAAGLSLIEVSRRVCVEALLSKALGCPSSSFRVRSVSISCPPSQSTCRSSSLGSNMPPPLDPGNVAFFVPSLFFLLQNVVDTMLCLTEAVPPDEGSVHVDVFHVKEALVSMNRIIA